jgi:hypothetical protein
MALPRYANKLRADEDMPVSEKNQKLRDVVAKVRPQVETWASDVETKLRTWWTGSEAGIAADVSHIAPAISRLLTQNQVEKAIVNIMDIAKEAQSDLGGQYAWLEDVTVQDWKRYHALVDGEFDVLAACYIQLTSMQMLSNTAKSTKTCCT